MLSDVRIPITLIYILTYLLLVRWWWKKWRKDPVFNIPTIFMLIFWATLYGGQLYRLWK